MAEKILLALFWGWPVLLGLVVWLTKSSSAVRSMDRLEGWLIATKVRLKSSQGWVARYWGRPTTVVALSPFSVTAPISDPFLRSGARVALAPYIAGAILVGTLVAAELAIALSCIFVMLMIWGFISSLGKPKLSPQPLSRVRGARLFKTSFWGDTPTGTRIDESGRVMEESFFGDTPSGLRIDEDGRIMKEGFLGDVPAGYQINADGRLVKEGFLGDTPTGTKIDENGRIVEEGFFGDTPTGYEFKKE